MTKTQRVGHIKYLLKFVAEKHTELFAYGIIIPIPKTGSQESKYLEVKHALEYMSKDQKIMFDAMREEYAVEQKAKDDAIAERAAAEEKANEER